MISPVRRLIQYPWGMHICDYQQKKDTRPVLRRGMPSAFHVISYRRHGDFVAVPRPSTNPIRRGLTLVET